MSKPHAPYYYKDDKNVDVYHWETTCSKNHYRTAGWKTSMTPPPGKKDQCNECKAK